MFSSAVNELPCRFLMLFPGCSGCTNTLLFEQCWSTFLIYVELPTDLSSINLWETYSRYIDQHTSEVWFLLPTDPSNVDQQIPATLTDSQYTLRMLINISGICQKN